MASTKDRSAAGSELRGVFAGAREDPTAGLAGALIGATDAAGAVTGLRLLNSFDALALSSTSFSPVAIITLTALPNLTTRTRL